MECLHTDTKKILLIVEGAKLERRFFERMMSVFGIDAELYTYNTNIYTLYQQLKEDEFYCDIKQVLLERTHPSSEQERILRQEFAYTYLVFDFDAHHPMPGVHEIDETVAENMAKVLEMSQHLVDETDPTKGRLYINYPMMEAYRDCEDFFDPEYRSTCVSIDDISQYKSMISAKRLASAHVDHFSKDNFSDLMKMNVYKLNQIANNQWGAFPYPEYLSVSEGSSLLGRQAERIQRERCMDVINTALFIVLDYFGNRNHFFDGVVGNLVIEKEESRALEPV